MNGAQAPRPAQHDRIEKERVNKSNISITFGLNEYSDSFLLELDDDKNAGSSTFLPGDTGYVKLYPAGQYPKLRTNLGTASIEAVRLPEEKEEEIIFTRDNKASLSYYPENLLSYEWIGRSGPSPRFGDNNIVLPASFSGILKVRYKTFYDRIKLISGKEGKILLEAIKDDRYGYIAIDFKILTRQVYLTVKDACTRTVIDNAQVYVDGSYRGNTNVQGRINLGEITVGKHSLRVKKSGYQDTDNDTIANDEFSVPSPPESTGGAGYQFMP